MSPNANLDLFCHNIHSLRKYCKLSQKEMAGQLHIGIKSLRKLENGVIPPRLDIHILLYIHRNYGFTPTQTVTMDLSRLLK